MGNPEGFLLFGTGEVIESCSYVGPSHSCAGKNRNRVWGFREPLRYRAVEFIDDYRLPALGRPSNGIYDWSGLHITFDNHAEFMFVFGSPYIGWTTE